MKTKKLVLLLCACILSLGLFGAGYTISKAAYQIKKMNRTLTVKGLAEKDVKSDLALWEINYREVGKDLVEINQRLSHDQEVIITFLKEHDFVDSDITKTPIKVEDRLANVYNEANAQANNEQRYVVTGGIRLRSHKVESVQKAVQESDELLQQGVPVTYGVGSVNPNPSYYFTQLDQIRPIMLSQAIRSARVLAEQFAKEAGVELAGVQHASQGIFQIMSRDTSTMNSDWSSNESALGSIDKKVRIVATIDYRLK